VPTIIIIVADSRAKYCLHALALLSLAGRLDYFKLKIYLL